MTRNRIELDNVSLRFRMSYHRTKTLPDLVMQRYRMLTGQWKPEFFQALNGINLLTQDGDILGIIGPNGAGKTTLLRTISGIYSPDDGRVVTHGKVSALLGLGVGFNTALSGRENIALGGLTLGYPLSAIEDRMDFILDFAELGDFIDVPMRYYSSGMMSRISFALVVSLEPDILLVDETLSIGDLQFRQKAKSAMQQLLKRASCLVIVSHSLATIRTMCNRAILVEHGKITADGEPKAVVEEYEGKFRGKTAD